MALYNISVVISNTIIVYHGTVFMGRFLSIREFKTHIQKEEVPSSNIDHYNIYYIIKIIDSDFITTDFTSLHGLELYVNQIQSKSILFVDICNFISSIIKRPLDFNLFKDIKINIYDKPFSVESGQRHIYEISLIEIKNTFTDGSFTDGGLTGIEIHGPNGYHKIIYDENICSPIFNDVVDRCLPYVDSNCYMQFLQNVTDHEKGFCGDSALVKVTNGLQEAIKFEF